MNIRRGAYLLAALGLASNPWQYLSNASTFLTVLSGFGVFRTCSFAWDTTAEETLICVTVAPFTGVMLADYLVVRRCVIKLKDCYIGNSTSLYWYAPWSIPCVDERLTRLQVLAWLPLACPRCMGRRSLPHHARADYDRARPGHV